MPVRLGYLAGLAVALELVGGLGEESFDLFQAAFLGRELQNLLTRIELELDAPGDGEREVTVGRLYLYAYRPLRGRFDHPLQERHALLGQSAYVLLRPIFEVLDVPYVVRLAAEDVLQPE